MQKGLKKRALAIEVLCALVVLTAVAFYLTRSTDSLIPKSRPGTKASTSALTVDESPLLTAHSLLPLATTQEEAQIAIEARHQADHEVDLAYTMALRRAHLQPPKQTPETTAINAKIETLEGQLKSDDIEIDRRQKLLAKPDAKNADNIQDELDLLQAQKGLHSEELEDAHQALIAAGGDNESLIQKQFKDHETLQHTIESAGTPSLQAAFSPPQSLASQGKLWLDLYNNRRRIARAQQEADAMASDLSTRSQTLGQRLRDERRNIVPNPTDAKSPVVDKAQRGATLAAVRAHVDWRKVLADYAQRISDEQQLSKLYGEWSDIVSRQITVTVHALLRSLLWILLMLTVVLACEAALERYLQKLGLERRQMTTLRMVVRLSLRTLGALCVLVVLFGPPTQLSTIVAFAGAGLTVALKDFIVAFFGWFVLMGKNGIHVGDWVEIDGISGEVVEIGLLRTVILETGNWNDSGHPTGRQVAFVNSFAMEKHYFNFTTKGQWLWDELSVLVPPTRDPNTLVLEIQDLVLAETKSNMALAEQEWQRATHTHGAQSLSAAPAVNIRPSGQGITIIVRYLAQANERHGLRARLYKEIVDMMRRPEVERSAKH